MNSPSHWVEIDLLRGKRLVRVPKKVGSHEYLVHVSKQDQRPRGLLYPIRLPQRLPVIPIPLKASDPDAASTSRPRSTPSTTGRATTWKSTITTSQTRLSTASSRRGPTSF